MSRADAVPVVVLAGGRGARFGAETDGTPKPLIEIGGRAVIGHVLAGFLRADFLHFVIASGYRADRLRDYVENDFCTQHGLQRSARDRSSPDHVRVQCGEVRIDLIDTGADTANGGRLRRLRPWLADRFVLCWADVLSDLDPAAMLAFHLNQKTLVTVAAVHPPLPFGLLELGADSRVTGFTEKPASAPLWVSAGMFVVEGAALDYLRSDDSSWERDALPQIAASGELSAFRYEGFWHPMDTPRDRDTLERLCSAGTAPWTTME